MLFFLLNNFARTGDENKRQRIHENVTKQYICNIVKMAVSLGMSEFWNLVRIIT